MSKSVSPIFLGGSFGFSFSKIVQAFWTQPQSNEGLGDKTCGQTSDFDFWVGCKRDAHAQLAPAFSGQPLVISQEQSLSVLQAKGGLDGGDGWGGVIFSVEIGVG